MSTAGAAAAASERVEGVYAIVILSRSRTCIFGSYSCERHERRLRGQRWTYINVRGSP